MADYYVIYNGTQYDVADFAAGVAKAKELGSSAVLYANAFLTEPATCDGVNTVFLAGGSVHIYGANSAITIQNGLYNYKEGDIAWSSMFFGGGTQSSITVSGGTTGNVYAGDVSADSGSAEVIVTGGIVGQIIASGKAGTLNSCNIVVSGGTIKALQMVGTGATVNHVTFTLSGNGLFAASGNTFLGGKGTLGDVTVNFNGGTFAKALFCTGQDASAETRTGATVVNFTNGFSNGTVVYGLGMVAPTAITLNFNTNGKFTNIFGGSNDTTGTVFECPVTINFNGGTAALICGSGYKQSAIKGNVTINFNGEVRKTNNANGFLMGAGFTKGLVTVEGNVDLTMTGGFVELHVCGGGNGDVQGNTTVTISGGTVGPKGYIAAGGRQGTVTGKATLNILAGADLGGVMGGGIMTGSKVLGGTEVNVGAAKIHGELIGGGREGEVVEGGITLNVNGGTILRDRRDILWRNGFIIGGGGSEHAEITGNIAVSITNTLAEGNIIGGAFYGEHHGNVDLTISNTTVGNTNTGTVDGGSIFVVAYNNDETDGGSFGTFTASISGVTALGSLYQGQGGNYIEGDTAITVANSSFGGGIYLEYGDFTLDPDTGAYDDGVETYINGDVAFNLTDVTVADNVWGKGRFYDLASFADGKGATLAVSGTLTAGGEVGYFDTITLAAGATIAAGTTTASAITATASETQGLYTLATGFAAQTCVVNVVNANGGTLGVVSLSESVTSGTFTAGGLDYTVSVVDNALKLQVGDDPGPTPPPTPTATGAEVILTITDPNHDYYGATGGWKVQADQTVAWQDLTTLGAGYSYLGLGTTAAGKAMPDIYVYNADAKYIGAYVTDDTGAIADFTSIFLGEGALSQVGIADFNGDGVSDLLLRTADGFVGTYANGTFAEVQGLGLEWTVAALGDVDGNGRADVIIAHEAGYVGAYLIGTDGSISWADLGNLDSSTAIVGAGDVNGDGTDDVIVQVGANYFGAWLCGQGAVTGFFGIGTFDAAVQDIADYNADGKDDLLFRTEGGVVGAALITGADATTWAEYGALGSEWSTKGVGIL